MSISRQSISKRQAWVLAARPKTLPAALTPVIVGSAVAYTTQGMHPGAAIASLIIALMLQIAANFANDVFDFHRGADSDGRTGPTRVTQSGLLSASEVMVGTWTVIAISVLCGMYLVARAGWPILIIGLLAVIAALAYTGGPAPIGYLGLGEVFVFIFFGLVGVAGTTYVQTLELEALALAAAVPIGSLIAAILVVNNLRDIETDARVGKRTIAVRLGRAATIREFELLITLAYAAMPAFWLLDVFSGWWWIPWLTVPLAIKLIFGVRRDEGRALNLRLAQTAQLALLFGLALSGSLVL